MSIAPTLGKYAAPVFLSLGLGMGMAAAGPPQPGAQHAPQSEAHAGQTVHHRHPSRQVGKASIYARTFAGRKMANGERMDPLGTNAASKTLPLGTTARVTNLQTGRSAVVTIEDRGPHVRGRIIDLSPATARQIGLTRKQGVAPVEVAALPSSE